MAKKRKAPPRKAATAKPGEIRLADGMVEFTIEGGEHAGERACFDVMVVRHACADAEDKHIPQGATTYMPTVEFIFDIYEALRGVGYPLLVASGEPYITPSLARGVWKFAYEATGGVRREKKTASSPNSSNSTE